MSSPGGAHGARSLRRRLTALLAVSAIGWCNAAIAGLDDGLDALRRKDFTTAANELRPLAERGDAEAQYRIGLMYEYGKGYPQDKTQGIAWFRKSADQNHAAARTELGIIYATGEGVAKDAVLAYANYAIAARGGNKEYVEYRDDIAKQLTPAQVKGGMALADAWTVGQPMPTKAAAAGSTPAGVAPVSNRCSASGTMNGERFTATYCVASLFGDSRSVAIWFNEEAITPQEAENFQLSSHADDTKGGRPRTMATIMFCPGGGRATASAPAVKSIDLNTNHARSPLAGIQQIVEAPKDLKVEKMTGDVMPGGTLSGRMVGGLGKTTFTFDFDLTLPTKDAAAGLSCGK